MPDTDPVDLLWTGGWDSTFRLLDLAIVRCAAVQPWYVIDEERPSSGCEVDAMLRIRSVLAERFPEAAERVRPTRYRERAAIPNNAENEARRDRLAERSRIGSQYAWLADFAATVEIPSLELSVHCDDSAHVFLEPHVEPADTPHGTTYQLRTPLDDSDLALFEAFRFPILPWTKPEMEDYAARHGFVDLMYSTWFCHSPRKGAPCGLCGPCGFAIDEGMRHRVPALRRLERKVRVFKRRLIG